MSDDPAFVTAIESAIKKYEIRIAIETGTFEGTGSTRVIAECMSRASRPIAFITLEAAFRNWCAAYHNLRSHLFVDCRWGCSVDMEGATEFMRRDDALNNHHKYPSIYIDDIEDPVGFYLNELNGMLGISHRVPKASIVLNVPFARRAKSWAKSIAIGKLPSFSGTVGEVDLATKLWSGEGLLRQFLHLHRNNRPLVVLDSAGGCGLYEFEIMMSVMRGASFLLLLDDTHHLKHFRSLRQIQGDQRFKVLDVNAYHGWALAWHE